MGEVEHQMVKGEYLTTYFMFSTNSYIFNTDGHPTDNTRKDKNDF